MLVLVSGMSSGGKSRFAEKLTCALAGGKKRFYIATMTPSDGEDERRIARHREMRQGLGFTTLEKPSLDDLPEELAGSACLLESVTSLSANELFPPGAFPAEEELEAASEKALSRMTQGVKKLASLADVTVVTGDALGEDGTVYDPFTEAWQKLVALTLREIAKEADAVYEVASSLPVRRK